MIDRNEVPKVNAGSMADIAFLLLIFFLVTTSIETDAGLSRMLPRIPDKAIPPPPIPERNILPVSINAAGRLMVNNEVIPITELKPLTIAFLDNGGASRSDERYCDYCQGKRDVKSSDSPIEAVVSLRNDRLTTYGTYISVQNELAAAYNALRNRESQRLFQIDFTQMEALYKSADTPPLLRSKWKERIIKIKNLFPMKLSEAELK